VLGRVGLVNYVSDPASSNPIMKVESLNVCEKKESVSLALLDYVGSLVKVGSRRLDGINHEKTGRCIFMQRQQKDKADSQPVSESLVRSVVGAKRRARMQRSPHKGLSRFFHGEV